MSAASEFSRFIAFRERLFSSPPTKRIEEGLFPHFQTIGIWMSEVLAEYNDVYFVNHVQASSAASSHFPDFFKI